MAGGSGGSADVPHRGADASAVLRLLCSVLAAGLLFAVLAPAAHAEAPGAISGTVTDSSTHHAVEGIQVCAIMPPAVETEEGPGESEQPPPCAKTNAAGEYTIGGLAAGAYYVIFAYPSFFLPGEPPPGSSSNYLPQAYENTRAQSAAKKVTVVAGTATTGIDAALEEGGEITGRVTDATSGAPIANAFVCAFQQPGGEELGDFGCATTGASGEYTIAGLAGGSFVLIFGAPGYTRQVYAGKARLSEGTPVSVTVKHVSGGINAALSVQPPAPPEGPGSSQGAPGSPAGSEPGAGSHPLGQATLVLGSSSIAVGGREARVKLACHAAAGCRGRLTLSAIVVSRNGRRRSSRRITLGSASFAVAGGRDVTVKIRLDAAGGALLQADRGGLRARLAVRLTRPGPVRTELIAVRLRAAKRAR
jgi:hypothetical protein